MCGRVCYGHGGSVRAERREDAIGGLNGQAKSAVCREERLKVEHICENEQIQANVVLLSHPQLIGRRDMRPLLTWFRRFLRSRP